MPVAVGRVGTWQQGDWHSPGLVQQPFLFAPDVCQGLLGQAPGRGGPGRVSAQAQQPGSAAISVPHMGPCAGQPRAGQGSHLKRECGGSTPASSQGQCKSPGERGHGVGVEHAACPGAPWWLSAPGLISACTPRPCQPPWALIDSKNMLALSWDRYCGFGRKLKGFALPHGWKCLLWPYCPE